MQFKGLRTIEGWGNGTSKVSPGVGCRPLEPTSKSKFLQSEVTAWIVVTLLDWYFLTLLEQELTMALPTCQTIFQQLQKFCTPV